MFYSIIKVFFFCGSKLKDTVGVPTFFVINRIKMGSGVESHFRDRTKSQK